MKKFIVKILMCIPSVRDYIGFKKTIINHVPFRNYLEFKLLGSQGRVKGVYWPVHPNSEVTHPERIFVGINSNPGTRPGCYIQGNGGLYIGNYVQFASNIGLISANHDFYEQSKHIGEKVIIGDYCWIGQGAIILPGVELGPRTIVGAGAIVTKSFPMGFCVLGGNPAKVIRELDRKQFVPKTIEEEYYGFVPKSKFARFARKHLRNNEFFKESFVKR